MKHYFLSHSELCSLIEHLRRDFIVIGPTDCGQKNPVFQPVTDPKDLVWNYTTTILPPKKVFMPPTETLLKFNREENSSSVVPPVSSSQVLLGVHPCDMTAICHLDWAFCGYDKKQHPEDRWIKRRQATTIFGTPQLPDQYCFATAMGSNDDKKGFDGFIYPLHDGFLISTYTTKGQELLEQADKATALPDPAPRLAEAAALIKDYAARETQTLDGPLAELEAAIKSSGSFSAWDKAAAKCLSCGSCNLVCPTCYCFDITDSLEVGLINGTRNRRWDACQLRNFTDVAGGGNFRPTTRARLQHRINRKFNYLNDSQNGRPAFCVGCGRCSRTCTADINIAKLINELLQEAVVGGA